MKKQLKYLIMICFLLLPLSVKADSVDLSISCSPTTVSGGDKVTCNLTGKTDDNTDYIGEIYLSISTSSGLTIDTNSLTLPEGNFSGGPSDIGASLDFDGKSLALYSERGAKGTFTFASFKANVASNVSANQEITISGIKFVTIQDSDKLTISDKKATLTYAKPSGLSNLSVPEGALDKAFSSKTYKYSVTLNKDATSFTVNATPFDSGDAVTLYNESVSDSNKLSSNKIEFKPATGKNVMSILVVTGESTYTLNVSKASNDTSRLISTMSVNGVSVNLSACKAQTCSVTIPASPLAYKVSVTLTDPDHYTIDESTLPNGSLSFPKGDSNFAISIVPKTSGYTGSEIYYVTVNRTGSNPSPSNTSNEPSENPKTGTASFIVVLVLLAISIGTSVLIYNKRIVSEEQ